MIGQHKMKSMKFCELFISFWHILSYFLFVCIDFHFWVFVEFCLEMEKENNVGWVGKLGKSGRSLGSGKYSIWKLVIKK